MSEAAVITTTTIEGWSLATGGFSDNEPRILDVDLAARLGYERPRAIRDLIGRMIASGKLNDSEVRRTVRQTSGRPAEEYWLTEPQALKVVAKSDTPKADALLDEVIRVFVLFRRQGAQLRALSDPATLRQLLGDYAERVQLLEGEIAEARPKVEVYDRLVETGDTVGFREACKLIRAATGATEPEVRALMIFRRWIQRLGGRLAPASYGQEQGYVTVRDREVTTTDGGVKVVPELRITQRGVVRAIERINKGAAA